MKDWIRGGGPGVLAALAAAWLAAGCAALPARVRPAEAFQPEEARIVALAPVTVPDLEPLAAPRLEPVSTNLPPEPKGRFLERGDRVRITLRHQEAEGPYEQVIDDEGRVNLPLIGAVEIGGLIVSDAQKLVEKAYIEREFYKRITVIIVPPDSEYTIYGEVIRPGAFPLNRGLTLLQAIGRSGRFTEFANLTKIQIRRGADTTVHNVNAIQKGDARDPDILPGDVIYVPAGWR